MCSENYRDHFILHWEWLVFCDWSLVSRFVAGGCVATMMKSCVPKLRSNIVHHQCAFFVSPNRLGHVRFSPLPLSLTFFTAVPRACSSAKVPDKTNCCGTPRSCTVSISFSLSRTDSSCPTVTLPVVLSTGNRTTRWATSSRVAPAARRRWRTPSRCLASPWYKWREWWPSPRTTSWLARTPAPRWIFSAQGQRHSWDFLRNVPCQRDQRHRLWHGLRNRPCLFRALLRNVEAHIRLLVFPSGTTSSGVRLQQLHLWRRWGPEASSISSVSTPPSHDDIWIELVVDPHCSHCDKVASVLLLRPFDRAACPEEPHPRPEHWTLLRQKKNNSNPRWHVWNTFQQKTSVDESTWMLGLARAQRCCRPWSHAPWPRARSSLRRQSRAERSDRKGSRLSRVPHSASRAPRGLGGHIAVATASREFWSIVEAISSIEENARRFLPVSGTRWTQCLTVHELRCLNIFFPSSGRLLCFRGTEHSTAAARHGFGQSQHFLDEPNDVVITQKASILRESPFTFSLSIRCCNDRFLDTCAVWSTRQSFSHWWKDNIESSNDLKSEKPNDLEPKRSSKRKTECKARKPEQLKRQRDLNSKTTRKNQKPQAPCPPVPHDVKARSNSKPQNDLKPYNNFIRANKHLEYTEDPRNWKLQKFKNPERRVATRSTCALHESFQFWYSSNRCREGIQRIRTAGIPWKWNRCTTSVNVHSMCCFQTQIEN